MNNAPRKRLYEIRWLRYSVVAVGVIFLVWFEGVWHFVVKQADPAATRWIRGATIVKKAVGDIDSLELIRSYSSVSFNADGNRSGRLHYRVHGTHSDVDLLVSWHRYHQDTEPVVDKVQWIDTKGFDTIWP